ncbi:hypothetical protein niasHT_003250 [Heterodera trifolii]|uniref:Uncharacterized protein n=1 Tax=Heterodera trifolii TaxID=157864 RepID=A0ABD2LUU8_9BILA
MVQTNSKKLEEIKTGKCAFEQYFCLMITCVVVGNPSYAFTDWQCSYSNNAQVCAERTEQKLRELNHFKNPHCKCEFGKFNEEMANEKPAAQLTTRPFPNLFCLRGAYDYKGYGIVKDLECAPEDRYCFIANCKTADSKEGIMAWGCMESDNCTAITEKLSTNKHKNYECRCAFGGFGANTTNEKMAIPSWILPPTLPTTTASPPIEAQVWSCLLKTACNPNNNFGNATKPGRRFKLKVNCQTVEERLKKVPITKMEYLSTEYFFSARRGPKPIFLEDFEPMHG